MKAISEPIEAKDLKRWLSLERNSFYYKMLLYKCEKCVSMVPDAEDHERLNHSPTNPYVCPVCTQTFTSESAHSSHVASHYYILNCSVCWYKCYSKHHMKHHLDQHRNEILIKEDKSSLDYICDYCGKKFTSKTRITTHFQKFHTMHKCDMCDKKYKQFGQLTEHKKLKHCIDRCEAAYCVPCDIQFDNVFIYKRHIQLSKQHRHERKQPPSKPQKEKQWIKCPECPNSYARKFDFQSHFDLVHAKKWKFVCQFCSKPFARRSQLKIHIEHVHEGLKLPKNKFCDLCGRGFSTKRTLNNHIRTHTGEKPFKCPHCESSFAQKVAMRSHVKNIHMKKQKTVTHSPPVCEA